MKVYRSKCSKLPGTSYREVYPRAWKLYKQIIKRTKRRPYVRSKYFRKDKIFIAPFWQHLNQKPQRDRKWRLRFYECAIDLLRHSTLRPTTKEDPNNRDTLLHRFAGISKEKELFFVQIKENKKTGAKYFISVFAGK